MHASGAPTGETPLLRARRGFTLLELLLALVIVGVLAAAAVPSAGRSLRRLGHKDSAQTLAANLRYAQARAITEGSATRLALTSYSGTYVIESANRDGQFERVSGLTGRQFQLPQRVRFGPIDVAGPDTTPESLVFHPDGRGPRGTIRIVGSQGSFEVSLSGRVGDIHARESAGK